MSVYDNTKLYLPLALLPNGKKSIMNMDNNIELGRWIRERIADGTIPVTVSSVAWSAITGTPTTLVGYGITDGLSTSTTYSGDVSGTYNTMVVNWSNGSSTYDTLYYPLSSNPANYLTSITSLDVTTALGYTPYNATNPSGFITSADLSPYLTSALAASTYQPISLMGLYLQTATAASTYVPLTRTLTINGTTFDLSANRSWTISSGGVSTIGTINSQTKSANGAVISGTDLVLQTADTTYPGLISTGAQTITGVKTIKATATTANVFPFSIEKSSAVTALFQIDRSGGIYGFSDAYLGTASTISTTTGSKILWIPEVAAFRAGYTSGTSWSIGNIGNLSAAFGFNTRASGGQSMSWGQDSISSANWSTSGGTSCTASGLSSFAIGNGCTASGESSIALGFSATASGQYATAFTGGTASARNAMSNGSGSISSGEYCHSFGRAVFARSWGEFAIGTYNVDYTASSTTSNVSTDRVFSIGIGNSGSPANAITVLKSGYIGIGTSAPTHQLELSTDDAYKPSTTLWGVISDQRVKTDILDYTKGLKDIMELKPVSYKYNNKYYDSNVSDKTNIGFIAQDIEKLHPEWVNTKPQSFYPNKEYDEKGNLISLGEVEIINDFKTINPSDMLYMMVNAIKELNNEIVNLKKIIESNGM